MANNPNVQTQQVRVRNYLAKDFDGLKRVIFEYARAYYPDRMSDFSENSLGGLLLDMAAYVGDNLSFYLDHQFNELNPARAIETNNLQQHLRNAGFKVTGVSPAIVDCTFSIECPATKDSNGNLVPVLASLPVIKAGTVVTSVLGVVYTLADDVDFSEKYPDGSYKFSQENGLTTPLGVATLILSRTGLCISGQEKSYGVDFDNFVPFRRVTIPDQNVTEVISVTDDLGNVYYEVNDLADDVVYKNIKNFADDAPIVDSVLQLQPAPYRFTRETDINTLLTTLVFGGGDALTMQDDIIPDPTEFAIPLPNYKTFSKTPLNPQNLLSTRTLGVAGSNTRVTIRYRSGGGLSHNSLPNTITRVTGLNIFFPLNPPVSVGQNVTNSVSVTNLNEAKGGEDQPSVAELRNLIASMRNSQERIVTKEDLMARVYTLPTNFGRVFRAGVRSNPDNPLATRLYVVSRDAFGNLTTSTDTLKKNLIKHLNSYRLATDAIDILDSPVVNLKIEFMVIIDPSYQQNLVLQSCIDALRDYFDSKNCQIDKPINMTEVSNIIYSINGVTSMPQNSPIRFANMTGLVDNRQYSDYYYNVKLGTVVNKGLLFPPEGGIFEVRYPDYDIVGRSV